MRKFSSHYIYPVAGPPLKYGILVTEDDGTVIELIDTDGHPVEIAQLEFYSGIIVPGLSNHSESGPDWKEITRLVSGTKHHLASFIPGEKPGVMWVDSENKRIIRLI